jgi:hypothetical protein
MKTVLGLLLSLFSVGALAHEIRVSCAPREYACGVNGCNWLNLKATAEQAVELTRDEDYPHEVYRGLFQESYDGHLLSLNITYVPEKTVRPVTVHALLDAGTVIAEATGSNSVSISLRNQTYGRGFNCQVRN